MKINKNTTIGINIWINEERYELLEKAGLTKFAQEQLAGMKVIVISCTRQQKDRLIQLFPSAKYDSSTTNTIELLPRSVKDQIFEISLKLGTTGTEVIAEFLKMKEFAKP